MKILTNILLGILILMVAYSVFFRTTTAFGSATGTTFNDSKVATIVFTPGTSATSTSILNTDASDRKIESFKYDCSGVGTSLTAYTGAGLASLVFTAATSSTASPAVNNNTNTIPLTVSTSTVDSFNTVGGATTTPALNRVWAAGSYMNFYSNATNTASCIIGVSYLGT